MTGSNPPVYSYSYTIGPPLPVSGKVTTSPTEVAHILIAFVVLTFDLVLILTLLPTGVRVFNPSTISEIVGIAAAAALSGFLSHEIAHKVSAERRGYWAEFRMSPAGLVFSVLFSYVGFMFAAPGATMIGGMADRRDWGMTSLAGPLTNLGWGAAFAAGFGLAARIPGLAPVSGPLLFLAYVNGFFAAFNLVPAGPLDGRKVWAWSRSAWAAAFVISVAFAIGLYLPFLLNRVTLP